MKKYSTVFKNDLEEGDVIKTKMPFKIELDEEQEISRTNIQNAAEILLPLKTAAEKEKTRNMKAGTLEASEYVMD